jgi:hypothetical protein
MLVNNDFSIIFWADKCFGENNGIDKNTCMYALGST